MQEVIRAKAPLRISFAGGGTDVSPYPEEKGGVVLNATINKYAYVTIVPTDEEKIEIYSLDYDTLIEYHKDEAFSLTGELRLVEGVVNEFRKKIPTKGFKMFVQSEAPPGSGLGASSTLVTAIIGAFREWLSLPFSAYDVAQMAYRIERIDLKEKGGRQDQYAASFGGVNFMEFYADKTVVNPLNIPLSILNELQYSLVLGYIGDRRSSSKIIEQQIKDYTEGKEKSLAAFDGIKGLAMEIKNALLLGKLDQFGILLDKTWKFKKDMTKAISNDKIDNIYKEACEAGALGGKISGAGGGGFIYFFCDFDKKPRVVEKLKNLGVDVVDFSFELNGLQTWRIKK